jgi:hypothetical protein
MVDNVCMSCNKCSSSRLRRVKAAPKKPKPTPTERLARLVKRLVAHGYDTGFPAFRPEDPEFTEIGWGSQRHIYDADGLMLDHSWLVIDNYVRSVRGSPNLDEIIEWCAAADRLEVAAQTL